MNKKIIAVWVFLIFLTSSSLEASSIRVLILDDVFRNIPEKNEQMEQMGKLSGDLFVSGTHYSGDIRPTNRLLRRLSRNRNPPA